MLLRYYVNYNYICMKEMTMKTTEHKFYLGQVKAKISSKVKDHNNDPYIVAKADRAAENVRKYGFPTELLRILAARMKK